MKYIILPAFILIVLVTFTIWQDYARKEELNPIIVSTSTPEIITKEIVKEIPVEKIVTKEVVREIVKEIPKEVIREKIIYQTDDLDCRLKLAASQDSRREVFALYYQSAAEISSAHASTTAIKSAYLNLLKRYDNLIELTSELNKTYSFKPIIVDRILQEIDFASSSKAFIDGF